MESSIFTSSSLNRTLSKIAQGGYSPAQAGVVILSLIKDSRRDFLQVLQGFEENLETLEAAFSATQTVIEYLEEAGGLTVRARNLAQEENGLERYRDKIKETEDFFLKTLIKLDTHIKDTSEKCTHLLSGASLVIKFDHLGHSTLTTQGINLQSEHLSFRKPDFSSLHTIQNSRIDVANAIDLAVTLRNMISSDIMTIKTRREFCEIALSFLSQAQDFLNSNTPESFDEKISIKELLEQSLFHEDEPLAGDGQSALLNSFKIQ